MQDRDYIHVASAYAATQDSNQWHDCNAGQPQPGLAQTAVRHRRRQGVANIDQVGFHLASTHQMAPRHTSDCMGLLLIYRPRKDKRLSWPSWLTCSGRFTHIVVTRRLQAERWTGSVCRPKTGVLPTVLCNQPQNTCTKQTRNQIHQAANAMQNWQEQPVLTLVHSPEHAFDACVHSINYHMKYYYITVVIWHET